MARSSRRREQGEFDFLCEVLPKLPQPKDVIVGPGHDAARIRVHGGDWLYTTDAQVEGVHFELGWIPLRTLGRRSFRVAASDIAAMGGRARFVLVDIGVPPYITIPALKRVQSGIAVEALAWNAAIVGGNLHRAQELMLVVTVIGQAPPKRVDRAGAEVGDLVVVSGNIGDAALCVRLLKAGEGCPATLRRRWQLPPRRQELGQALAIGGLATAMIDVSDGVVQDLQHICTASGVGADIDVGSLPLSRSYRQRLSNDPTLALCGGEDYELLFTVHPKKLAAVHTAAANAHCRVHVIGRVTKGCRVVVKDGPRELRLAQKGFDHFAPLSKVVNKL